LIVRSLFSNHPSLEIFYSGDRSGLVCKFDLESCSEISEGECILLLKDTDSSSQSHTTHGEVGISKIIAKDDTYVWTAGVGGSEVKRWKDVKSRTERVEVVRRDKRRKEMSGRGSEGEGNMLGLREVGEDGIRGSISQREGLGQLPLTPPSVSSTTRQGFQTHTPTISFPKNEYETDQSDTTIFGIPIESLISLAPPDDLDQFGLGTTNGGLSHSNSNNFAENDFETIYSSGKSVISVPAGMRSLVSIGGNLNSPTNNLNNLNEDSEQNLKSILAQKEFQERETALEAVPLFSEPDWVIEGSHGLIRVELLNDKRHVLSVDTRGDVALWDVVQGRCVGVYESSEVHKLAWMEHVGRSYQNGNEDRNSSNGSSDGKDLINFNGGDVSFNKEALQLVKERIEGQGITSTFCTIDSRIGKLTIHLEESRCFDAEIYWDEIGFGGEEMMGIGRDDQRIVLGKWILRNLFKGFIEEERRIRNLGGGGIGGNATESLHSPTNTISDGLVARRIPPRHISISDLRSRDPNYSLKAPQTPGMTIGLATPAATPALPLDLKDAPSTVSLSGTRIISPRIGQSNLPTIPQSPNLNGKYSSSPILKSADLTKGGENGSKEGKERTGNSDYFSYPSSPPSATPLTTSKQVESLTTPKPSDGKLLDPPPPIPGTGTGGAKDLSLIGRLKSFGGRKKQQQSETTQEASVVIPDSHDLENVEEEEMNNHLTEEERNQLKILFQVLSRPFLPLYTPLGYQNYQEVLYPIINFTEDLPIIISEETAESGAWVVIYRGLTSSTARDADILEMISPHWLLEVLLGGRFVVKEASKVHFVLLPLSEGPNGTILPALPNG
jgi:WD repeat-containing protein 48